MAKNLIDRLIDKVGNSDMEKLSERNYFKDNNRIWAKTGCPELETNIGGFGFPIGLTEVAGSSKSGKTTLALTGMRNFQKDYKDGFCTASARV
jgi:RecA/RadA recombinase